MLRELGYEIHQLTNYVGTLRHYRDGAYPDPGEFRGPSGLKWSDERRSRKFSHLAPPQERRDSAQAIGEIPEANSGQVKAKGLDGSVNTSPARPVAAHRLGLYYL